MSEDKNDIKNKTDEELVEIAGKDMLKISSVDSGIRQKAQAELMRRLMNSIKDLNKTTSKYSKVLICLTVILIVLTALLFIVAVIQICVSIKCKI
jgi:hypothetical protein